MRDQEGNLTRREFAGIAAAGAITACIPGSSRAEANHADDQNNFFFIAAADPQLFWGPLELWEKAVGHANRLRPAFMVVCGDLVQHPGNDEEARAYLKVAATLAGTVPLYNVAGNHDVQARPTPQTLAWYRKHFGEPWYSFQHGGCLFIVLESDVLNQPQDAPQMAEQQMAWLRETLANASKQEFSHKIIFKHYPLCLQGIDEKDHYFNVPRPRREELLELFHKHGVCAVFCGHYHRNAYVKDGELELITTSSLGKPLGKDPTGFRIVKVSPDRIQHAYYGYEEMPEKVDGLPSATN